MKCLPLFAVLLLAACIHTPVGDFPFPEGEVQHVVRGEEVAWRPCQPPLPDGAEMAVLEGNPGGDGLFTVRFRAREAFVMPPHTHPRDERVTVIEGTIAVAFGEGATRDQAEEFGPGDYYVNARGAVHTVWADAGCVVQITGLGPWAADFLD